MLKVVNREALREPNKRILFDQCLLKGESMEYNIGDIVRTKKVHPCGSKLWEITRVGVDFKLKCQGCGHVVTLERQKALKAITKLEKKKET